MARFLMTAPKIVTAALLSVALSAPAMAADTAAGAKVFKQACGVCHAAATSGVGPALGGVVGRKAGSLPGYASRYSPAMKAAGFAWTADKLSHYIANPAAVVPGNHMPYAGLKDAGQVASIVASLTSLK